MDPKNQISQDEIVKMKVAIADMSLVLHYVCTVLPGASNKEQELIKKKVSDVLREHGMYR